MEKVVCNVLYSVNVPVVHREIGDTFFNLGLFEDREDACCSGLLAKKILENKEDFDFLSVEDYKIAKEYIPESEMNKQHVASRFHPDINHFVTNNPITAHFLDKRGIVALEMLAYDCISELEVKDQDQNESKVQKGE